jgi:hypothetical protein
MGDIDKEDSVSDGTGLGLKSNGFSHDLLPRTPDRIALQWDIDLQGLKGLLQD